MSTNERVSSGVRSSRASLFGALLLGLLLARVLLLVHAPHLASQIENAKAVLELHPYSAALQTRLLGPFLVRLVGSATGLGFESSYVVVFVSCVVSAVMSLSAALGRYGHSAERGLLGAALGALAIVLLQDDQWLHLWDLLDVLFSVVFAYAIFTDASLSVFAALFAVQLTNRESALFVPLWLVLSSLPSLPSSDAEPRRLDAPRLAFGGAGIALGLTALGVVRRALYRGAPSPRLRPVTPWGNHFTLKHNVVDFAHALRVFDWGSLALYVALAGIASYVYGTRQRLPRHAARVPALLLMMAGAVLIFGLVLETRSFLGFVPLVLFCGFTEKAGASS